MLSVLELRKGGELILMAGEKERKEDAPHVQGQGGEKVGVS